MKREITLNIMGLIALICIIFAVFGLVYWMFKEKKADLNENTIKSNMLLIEGACKILYEDSVMKKTTDNLVGTKISDVENAEYIDKEIINKFKETNTIEEGDYEKFYILTDTDLESLKLSVRNEKYSYYIIGYEKDEVIITKGYNGKYKLSEINAEEREDESKDDTEKDKKEEEQKSEEGEENNDEQGEREEEKPEEN